METDAGHSPVAKKFLVEAGIGGLPKYRRELALDLLYGRVRLPASWLTPDQHTFVDLDGDAVQVHADGRELVARVVWLCDEVIPQLIEDFLRREAARSALDRGERESLRRGTGPAAVREALFRTCVTWPREDPLEPDARPAVDRGLHAALASRRARQNPDTSGTALPFAADVETGVRAYAARRRLTPDDENWLLSEVFDQLARNLAQGRAPRNVAAWTRATARKKLALRRAIEVPRRSTLRPDLVRSEDDLARVDFAATLVGTGKRLARLAHDLRLIGELENAAVHDLSATILLRESADTIASFLEGDDPTVADRLREQGRQLSPERRRTAVELIKETLRDALHYADATDAS
jgi:hypothetical protein